MEDATKVAVMRFYKAIRHITLAQASRATRILQRTGHAEAAEEIARTADCLQFGATDCGAPTAEIDDEAPAGKSVRVRVVEAGEVKMQKLVPVSLFRLYNCEADGLSGVGEDPTEAVNAAAARALLAECHAVRLGRALDMATETVLAGRTLPLPAGAAPSTPRSVWIGLGALTLIAFGFSFWQCQRSFNFIDVTYLLENLNFMAQGRVPYRDFFLVLPPMHYWIHSLAFQWTGGSAFGVACSGAAVQALTVLAAFWACQAVERSPYTNLIFAVIPAVTGVAAVGQPAYDCDAVLAVTLAIGALLRAENASGGAAWGWALAAGVAAGASVLVKINIGVPLLAGMLFVLAAGRLLFVRFPRVAVIGLVLGVVAVLGTAACWLAGHDALGPMIEQTLCFPAQVRLDPFGRLIASLPLPRLYGYSNLFWAALLALLWVLVAFGWFAGIHRRPVSMLLPLVLMAVCLGAMQSQDFGSVYGLGAIASLTLAVKIFGKRARTALVGFAAAFSAVLAVSDVEQERLRFMGDLLIQPCDFREPHLHGMQGNTITVAGFEAAVDWAKTHVKEGESAFWWPGTAPFYLATGLRCPLSNFQVLRETGMSPQEALAELRARRVTWVLVDRSSERIDKFGKFKEIEAAFQQSYDVADHVEAVTIYRLREAS
jgi:hypothetical protein